MKKFFPSAVLLLLLAGLLNGCQNNPLTTPKNNRDSGNLPTVAMAHGLVKNSQPLYPVPPIPVPNSPGSSDLELLPPGNLTAQLDKHITAGHNPSAHAELNQNGLQMAMNSTDTWVALRSALQKEKYRVLDEDRNMMAYYILDTDSTHGKITHSTPVYRMQIHSKGTTSNVELYDEKNHSVAPVIAQRILSRLQNDLA